MLLTDLTRAECMEWIADWMTCEHTITNGPDGSLSIAGVRHLDGEYDQQTLNSVAWFDLRDELLDAYAGKVQP